MKFPMSWHKESISNSTISLAGQEASLARMATEIERYRASHDFYASQIAEAERRCLDGFDSERFMVKRKT